MDIKQSARFFFYFLFVPESVFVLSSFDFMRERREELNLSMKETAERSDITSAYLSFIECGKKTPNVDVFARLLNTLNMSADAALLDSLTAAQDEKSSYLQYKLIGLDPERRLMALRAFECFIEGLKQ